MKNGSRILWSERALTDLRNILDYLSDNWSENDVRNFVNKLEKRLQLISTNPKLFPKTGKRKNIRRSVLTKQIIIYYQNAGKGIINIITLFDVRQNPDKLKI